MSQTIKCPECGTISTVRFSSPGMVLSYCPACGADVSSEPEEEDTEEE